MVKTVLLVLSVLVLGVLGLPLNAQDRANNAPAAPTGPVKNEAPKPITGAGAETQAAGVDPNVYVIGGQDVLFIRVWREMDFTGSYVVRPDGKITIPLVGEMQASGLTPLRLSDQLKQALSEYINAPDVNVTVSQVNSKKFSITGKVLKPGEYPLILPTKVFDALSNAGGFQDFANKKKITIIRGAERIRFNYSDVLRGKDLDTNIYLENGDTVVVP